MDLRKLKLDLGPKKRQIDPILIFNGLTQRGEVETLYGPQQEALNLWHKSYREKSDVLISMSTGGGKTLVGLLAAQSLVNELRRKVLYLCPTNQLVEQTAAQARDCGISVATYGDKKWNKQAEYDSCEACCVTNYHAVFRGGASIGADVRAILFDDAHVAPSAIRSCFTITIGREHDAWEPLIGIVRRYFKTTPLAGRFEKIASGNSGAREVLFVPGWYALQSREEIAAALADNKVESADSPSSRYSYRHLQDHLVLCAFFIGAHGIDITPTVLPTHALPFFGLDVRRIYLTATLPSRYDCIRTFGVSRAEVVAPSGKINAAQRLFVMPRGSVKTDPYQETRDLIKEHKACIIVPSRVAGKKWHDIGTIYDSRTKNEGISEFAEARDARKMILAGVFDGIDLPGKACKVLVLDGIPRGTSLHDRFLEDNLDSKRLRLVQITARLTQAIGRIFRSNTDHGVVIIADKAVQSWLREPTHRASMPSLLQRQIVLGFKLNEALATDGKVADYPDLMHKVVEGSPDWDDFYNSSMDQVETENKPSEESWGDAAATAEYAAWRDMWQGRYGLAATALSELGNSLLGKDNGLAAWHLHWSGVAFYLHDDPISGDGCFREAANVKMVLGRPVNDAALRSVAPKEGASAQAGKSAKEGGDDFSRRAERVLRKLEGPPGVNADDHEQGLCDLGLLLGFEAYRPEKHPQVKKGPDVVWCNRDAMVAIGIDAKTGMEVPVTYKKRHIGDSHHSEEWLRQEYSEYELEVWIVGAIGPVVRQAIPSPKMLVVAFASLIELARKLTTAARRVGARSADVSLPDAVQEAFRFYGLLWPIVVESVEYQYASDLQDEESGECDEG